MSARPEMPETRLPIDILKPASAARLGRYAAIVVSSALLLTVPLYLWRISYPLTDWAAIFLVALALMLFAGFYWPRKALLWARHRAAVRAESWISVFMRGKIRATIDSLAFVAVAVPILAWQALATADSIAPVLILLCMVASSMALGMRCWLERHFRGAFAASWSFALGAGAAAIMFVPLLAWINWNHVLFPGEFRSLGFLEAVQFGVAEQLPLRRGWIAEILALPVAIESAQLWLTARYGSAMAWVPGLYSIYLALVAFVVARASTALASFAGDELRKSCNESTSN